MEGIIILIWIALSFACAVILEKKNTGFWGTFGICLLLSPLLGVIIAVSSGNRAKPLSRVEKNKKAKKDLLNQIEELKKEEELGLISDVNKLKLDELVESYKKYDEQVLQTNEKVVQNKAWIENSANQKVQMPSWKSTIFITLGLFIALIIIAFISRLI
jgi:uncharacterized membrane protein